MIQDSETGTIPQVDADLTRPRLLLHICCAPCSTHVVQALKGQFDLTGHFYNPNIHPEAEYLRRAAEIEGYSGRIGLPLLVSRYDPGLWREAVRGLEDEPEGGERCLVCYRLRLERTASLARGAGFTHFTTSLSVSPHKRADAINAVGREVASRHRLEFYAADFKKKDGFTQSLRLSREAGLYRQNYCGCVYSLEERERRKRDLGRDEGR
ncbi:MAG: epoxyqueuosine reductase QueH [Dehalococcoidia bacterium]|nr:epoxyqueuosine reductase QueH [Dehalococcoidia bacterium]